MTRVESLAIGILGYNEAYGIVYLLDSLRAQTLLSRDCPIEISVISNGSQDNMAAVAKAQLADFHSDCHQIKTQVVELPTADKCAAWNYFVHQLAKPADCYILLDADVVLCDGESLARLVKLLEQLPDCRIAGGQVINAKQEVVNRDWVDGKCYALRGEIARNLHIPAGIVLDDAYLASTVLTNWYEISSETGLSRGYMRLVDQPSVRCGNTPRDRKISYWIAARKRTITAEYTQRHVDFCMRSLFGGGEAAKAILMKLATTNPDWFTQYLAQVSDQDWPRFDPPSLQLSPRQLIQVLAYCYSYLLSVVGIRNREFGHLAWKLKHRYW
ncbi:MAG: glycosyltransferase family 2 protein [Pegethrix bostrychoides GSE-TBD4-15B]|jgi:glycosyltransferase involved in cell wall biosynthesis|uniref:Glycosyltransferase family 2 protein n=1 Tax=Pegethrix bostrychoides GSE-TBD4-15B TaxID=2839662 RepID=A0A951U3I6_9CYAN|nr:glycosyltransferase family 2 protein [Pegethrix bostrychoides GSE-TBD4-15B]